MLGPYFFTQRDYGTEKIYQLNEILTMTPLIFTNASGVKIVPSAFRII